MLAILKAPFPPKCSEKNSLVTAILIGVFVGLFLYLFKPFGMGQENDKLPYPLLKYMGLGVMSFLGVVFVEIIFPSIYPAFFQEEKYTVTKEIIMGVITLFTITIFNVLFLKVITDENLTICNVFGMLWQVFLVGVFPLSLLTLLKYNRLLTSNLAISSQIQIAPSPATRAELRESLPSISFSADSKEPTIDLSGLLYVESEGNYVNVTTFRDGELARTLIRKTLKSMEAEFQNGHIQRCHRSYIVNLQKVVEVSGNAQGLKLTLKDCKDWIPVSRKYISDVKNYFS